MSGGWTPGPWKLAEGNASNLVYALDDNNEVNRFSARVEGGYVEHWRRSRDASQRTSDDEVAANARLIAAAPDLAEALADIFDHYSDREQAPGHDHDVPGVWDSDNGPLAGKPCDWCAKWERARTALSRTGRVS